MKTMLKNLLIIVLLSPLAVWAVGPTVGPNSNLSWTAPRLDVFGSPVQVIGYRLLFTTISGDYSTSVPIDIGSFVSLPLVHVEFFGDFRFADGQQFCVIRTLHGTTESIDSTEVPFVFQRIIPDPRSKPLSPTGVTF